MIVEAKEINGIIINKYETHLECSSCGMTVDNEEYNSGICSDCGNPWDGKKHIAIHVTSVPAKGASS